MFKNVIFDWSGVINDSIENHLLVVNKIFKRFGANEISMEELRENWLQPYMLFYNKYFPDLTIEEEQAVYKECIVNSPKSKPYLGIADVLKSFKIAEVKMVILSSDSPETLLPEMADFGLDGVFTDIVMDAYDKSKSIRGLIDRNNFKAEETIFIGDSNHEIEEGKRIGIKTGAVTWGYCTKTKLESLNPDFVIDTLEELKSVIL
ncbi:MAG: NUDIX hydrolase [Candidatus Magasanikbacteria bacterium GW2011_GWC2_34_16]|uniref:NUDIX hydrolase n=2 Tax=Candidatus Magasanikiibacteriota TaxID=1752731 RepID=A0A0G0KGN2_9BACT|nr:MAG: NUDIX hydrolase [Candidatus Magasanikbacteria bacterium GW2011_GWC2_34_16]KKQ39746.1 MAG: NUDIX hydrolase [Candidatus Magasanikbacteria bacterium GW2011_GWA2_37_8]